MSALNIITLKQLRALDHVSREGTISSAAEMLSLTPPAVHSQLKTLESNLGAKLLKKTENGGFSLTEEGRVLLVAYQRSQTALERAMYEIEALRRGVAGTVSVGVVSTGKYFAPGIVARVNAAYPEINVRLVVGNRNEIIEGLESERIDLAVMGRPPRFPPNESFELGPHPHILVAAPDSPIACKEKVTAQDILNETIILREQGSGTRILTMRFLDRIGEGTPYESTVMGSNETIKQSVRAGLGIAILSAHTCIDELEFGRLRAIRSPGLPINRHWFVLHRRDIEPTPALENVLKLILDNASEMVRSDEVLAAIG